MRKKIVDCPRKFRGGVMHTTVCDVVSNYLRQEFGPLRHAAKLIARKAGATPRTAEAWLAGRHAPYGEHLVNLMAECDGLATEINNLIRERRGCGQPSFLNSVGAVSGGRVA